MIYVITTKTEVKGHEPTSSDPRNWPAGWCNVSFKLPEECVRSRGQTGSDPPPAASECPVN